MSDTKHPLQILFTVVMAFTLVFGFTASDAEARNHRGGQAINVQFDHLSVSTYRDRVVVDYQISSHDWRELQWAGISPNLELHLPQGRSHRYSFHGDICLESRSGTATFHNARPHRYAEDVEIRLTGHSRRAYVSSISYARSRGAGQGLLVALPSSSYASSHCSTCGHQNSRFDRDYRRDSRYDRDYRRNSRYNDHHRPHSSSSSSSTTYTRTTTSTTSSSSSSRSAVPHRSHAPPRSWVPHRHAPAPRQQSNRQVSGSLDVSVQF